MQKRIILLWMLYFMLVCNTLITISLNIAIISMVRPIKENDTSDVNHSKTVMCPNTTFLWGKNNEKADSSVNLSQVDVYDWSIHEKRVALSSYHWLSWLSILPGSVLGQKFGSKVILEYCMLISALLSSVIPFVAQYGAKVVMFIRMVQGFFSFIVVPGACMTIMGNWSSEQDRGIFLAAAAVGSATAQGLGNIVFGYVGRYLHWKYIFYTTTVCGIIWTVLWNYLVFDYPDTHPTISLKEKTKLLKNLKGAVTSDKIPIPWMEIFTSVPAIVCTLVVASSMTNFFILVTFMPTYLNEMYGLKSDQAGTITSLPSFLTGSCGLGMGWLMDFLVKKRWTSLTNTRKIFTFGGCITSALMLVVMAFTKCNLTLIIISYLACSFARAVDMYGVEPNVVDISPRFCGIVQGLIGTVSEVLTLSIIFGMSQLTTALPTETFWKVVFLVTASFGIVSSISFLIWGTADVQPWNDGSRKVRYSKVSHMIHVSKQPQSDA